MKKFLASSVAALGVAATVLATATPAEAARRHYRHHHRGGGDTAAAVVLGGIAGLAIGSALSSSGRSGRGYVSSGYYYDGPRDYYYDDYRPRYRSRTCISRERVWDPYIERRVVIERRYPC